ncbi:unnamed protein product [Cyclocybe aegerita]|uniref:Uncharacterized protein n=1 Tax=Cyclocybe aegerita TaxID=1973307 RepID=A0A8S0VTY4_CYCAE|nr:unnamed protein product [Cyclocybe aegerita]
MHNTWKAPKEVPNASHQAARLDASPVSGRSYVPECCRTSGAPRVHLGHALEPDLPLAFFRKFVRFELRLSWMDAARNWVRVMDAPAAVAATTRQVFLSGRGV